MLKRFGLKFLGYQALFICKLILVSYQSIYTAPKSLLTRRHCSCNVELVRYLNSSHYFKHQYFLQEFYHICHFAIFSQYNFYIILDTIFSSAISLQGALIEALFDCDFLIFSNIVTQLFFIQLLHRVRGVFEDIFCIWNK